MTAPMEDEKIDAAIEYAYNRLVLDVHKGGVIKLVPVPLELKYLPAQELARQFHEVCRNIIMALKKQ